MGFNKNEIFETLIKIGLAVLLFVVIMIITLGFSLDFDRLKDIEFWVQVGLQLAFTMCVFNMVVGSHSRTISLNKKSRFYIAYATNKLKISEIQNGNLYDALIDAVKKENEEIYIKKCNDKLHRLSVRVHYQDVVEHIDNLDEFLSTYNIKKEKDLKKLKVLCNKVVAGQIKIKEIKDTTFLRDKEVNHTEKSMIVHNVIGDKLWGNAIKIATFLIISMLIQMLVTNYNMQDFWSWFISNLTLFISAIYSGFVEARREIRLKTAMYEERNDFLLRRLNISNEFKSE